MKIWFGFFTFQPKYKKTMLPKIFLTALAGLLALTSCSDPRPRAKPHVPSSDTDLVTGCYYITNDSTMLRRYLPETHERFFIDPHPIVTVDHFKELKKTTEDPGYLSITVSLDEPGTTAWTLATEKYANKRIAVIVRNNLLMAPTVNGKIEGGVFVISGSFDKKEQEMIYQEIDSEMYAPN